MNAVAEKLLPENAAAAVNGEGTPRTERVELTIGVAESVMDISMTGVQIECAAEIVGAAVAALMTVTQRERRDAERNRVR